MPQARRLRIAAAVGSDLPLFLVGGTVLGVGRGEEVYPMADFPATPIVVVTPEVGVSTPRAFADWDQLTASGASDRLLEVGRAFPTLSVPGLKTTLNESSFRNIPNCET